MLRPGQYDEQRQRWTEGLIRELGETIVRALGSDDVVEVLLNPDGRIWLDSRTEGMYDSGARLLPQEAEAILASIAGMLGTQIDSEHPIIEAELPLDGSRIEGMVPPLVASPCFAIRKRATRVFPLAGYRRIYLWEYLHRLLARILALAFALPLALFAWRRRLPRGFGRPLGAILALGLVQGVAGWWMVASGLVDEPRVSHLRLAAHLGLALILFAAMLATALELRAPRDAPAARGFAPVLASVLVAVVFLQALAGALMAGSRAGYLFPTFPKMAGELVPSRMFAVEPWIASFWRDLVTIHFVHRWSGVAIAVLATVGLAAAFLVPSLRGLRGAAAAVATLAATTAGLGVVTVVSGVAIVPAVVHQLLAVALLAAALVARHEAARAARYGASADQASG